MTADAPLIDEVRAVLSAEEFVLLAENFGGDRLYVPKALLDRSRLVIAMGHDAAARIIGVCAGCWMAVPLARRERALTYQAQGLKDHEIARKLCMSRSGVQKLLDREAQATASD